MPIRLKKRNVDCRMETLPAGDYAWVAQNKDGNEFVLDLLIERKEISDMDKSLRQQSKDFMPLNRMKLQMWKMMASGVKIKSILLEGSFKHPKQVGSLAAAKTFAKRLEAGKCGSDISLIQTMNASKTVDRLVQTSEELKQKLPSSFMNPPMTFDGMKNNVHDFLNSVTFRYYATLRKIPGIGEESALNIFAQSPTIAELQSFVKGSNSPEAAVSAGI